MDDSSATRKRWEEEGRCKQCGKQPAKINRKSCPECLLKSAKASAARGSKNTAKGLCRCGDKPAKGKVCENCKKYNNLLHKGRVQKGLCIRCASLATGGLKTCTACREKGKVWSRNNKPTRYRSFFKNAVFQVRSTRNGKRKYGSTVTALDLLRKWKAQRGTCALSGKKLTRHNAEVDHKVPACRGGQNYIDNLQWTSKDANRAKQGLTEKEFIDLCSAVMAYRGEGK